MQLNGETVSDIIQDIILVNKQASPHGDLGRSDDRMMMSLGSTMERKAGTAANLAQDNMYPLYKITKTFDAEELDNFWIATSSFVVNNQKSNINAIIAGRLDDDSPEYASLRGYAEFWIGEWDKFEKYFFKSFRKVDDEYHSSLLLTVNEVEFLFRCLSSHREGYMEMLVGKTLWNPEGVVDWEKVIKEHDEFVDSLLYSIEVVEVQGES